ncbi:disks large homolog 5-like [Apodemus sylvaticus]|uniref:disks large homolog 5-like n=1 Tax=Apodemus sylvaticus TaxID=10129 RepID=UPI002244B618|nr:disks large homolog 5-like [Apodemus sylvaticus]
MELCLPGDRPYYKPNPFYEKLKLKEKEIMAFLQNLEMENIEARQKFEEYKKEINFYRNLESCLLIQKDIMNKRLAELKQENKEVHADWTIIQQYLIDLNLNDKFEKEKARILQDQQHQCCSNSRALRFLSQCLENTLIDMFARLRKLFRRTNVDGRETRERRKEAGLSSESNEGQRRWSWRMWRSGRQTSSPVTVLSKNQAKEEEERLTRELQLVTQERNELRDRLIYVTEGAMNKRPYYTPNPLYEKLKLKEKEIMTFLHTLEKENIEAKQTFQDLKKEINFYRNLHSRLLMQKNIMNKRLVTLKQENKEVHADWTIIQQYLIDLNLNVKDEQDKTSILQGQQHQDAESVARAEISTAQEEGLLQNELPLQEDTANLHPQQPQNSLDESSTT